MRENTRTGVGWWVSRFRLRLFSGERLELLPASPEILSSVVAGDETDEEPAFFGDLGS